MYVVRSKRLVSKSDATQQYNAWYVCAYTRSAELSRQQQGYVQQLHCNHTLQLLHERVSAQHITNWAHSQAIYSMKSSVCSWAAARSVRVFQC
jgi:hypothetical protein